MAKTSLDIEARGGSIDLDALGGDVFPFDAFSMDSDTSVLTLSSPWTLDAEIVAIAGSWGTPYTYYFELLNTNPADANWHAIDVPTISGCPTGIKGVFVYGYSYGATVGRTWQISNADGGNPLVLGNSSAAAGTYLLIGSGPCPVDASNQIWWNAGNADVTNLTIRMTVYYM